MTLPMPQQSSRMYYANLRKWWDSLADAESGSGWAAYGDELASTSVERVRDEKPAARPRMHRLPYASLLNAVATTDRIARRSSGHTAATMLFGALAIASLSTPARATISVNAQTEAQSTNTSSSENSGKSETENEGKPTPKKTSNIPFDIRIESEKPGMQTTTATFNSGGIQTFDKVSTGTGKELETDFGTDGKIKGKYTNLEVRNADQYGGADGTGRYAVSFTKSGYTLDLESEIEGGVNYFGYWLSALDGGNKVTFLRSGREIFTFNPQDVLDGLAKTGIAKSYYGNPNEKFAGKNTGEPYVFVNFFSDNGGFDQIHFYQDPRGGGYESDNHTVGNFKTKGTGTVIAVGNVPEPAVWATMIVGLGMVGVSNRKRNRSTVAA